MGNLSWNNGTVKENNTVYPWLVVTSLTTYSCSFKYTVLAHGALWQCTGVTLRGFPSCLCTVIKPSIDTIFTRWCHIHAVSPLGQRQGMRHECMSHKNLHYPIMKPHPSLNWFLGWLSIPERAKVKGKGISFFSITAPTVQLVSSVPGDERKRSISCTIKKGMKE